jgi:hypothetical protein
MVFGYFLYWRCGMALIKCPECARQVSDAAVACPGCGYPIAEGAAGVEIYETAGWSANDRKSLSESLTLHKVSHEFNDEGDLVVTFSSTFRDALMSDICFFSWLHIHSNGEPGASLPRDKWELLSEGQRKARRSKAARKHARGAVAPRARSSKAATKRRAEAEIYPRRRKRLLWEADWLDANPEAPVPEAHKQWQIAKANGTQDLQPNGRSSSSAKGIAAAPQGAGLAKNPNEKHNNKVRRRKSGVLKLGCDRCGLMNAVDYDTVDAYINPNSRKNRNARLIDMADLFAKWEPKNVQAIVCAQCQYPLVHHL